MNSEKMFQLIYDDLQILKGQQKSTNERLDRMDERLDGMDKRLDGMDKRLDGMDKRLDGMDERFDRMDERLDGMDKRLDGMDKRLDGMDKRLDRMDKRFDEMDKRFICLEEKVLENAEGIRRINLCLENEIRPSIMRIAEGHLDLNRKLDEALKIDQEKEKLVIRMNFLEGKVERLDKKVSGLMQA